MPSSQLIPPPDLAPPSLAGLAPADRVRLWAQMVEEGDRLVFAGFLRRHGDEAAARLAADEWLARRAADSLVAKLRILGGGRSAGACRGE